ncbi:MAG: DNA polymerase III subunit beta [Bacteroidota bacterium]
MNFLITSSTLLKHLQSISGVLSTNNTLPILDNFLFEIKENSLAVTASDLETTMQTTLQVDAKEGGKVAIPAKLLLEVLKNLADQPLTFTVKPDSHQVEIAYENGKSKMVGFNGEDFPKTPSIEKSSTMQIAGDVLSKAINKTLFATGTDDLRPVMSGVFCQFSGNEITFVATDAHKLVRYTRKDVIGTGSSSFILPKKPLNILKSNLSSDDDVQLEFNESNVIFTFRDLILMSRLIDGKYPNYEAVIPKENPNVLTIDRSQFLSSIKRVSIFANKATHQIKLKIAGSELALSAEDVDFSNEANERLTCNYNGDDLEIGFNSRFLIEMLNNLDTPEIRLEMSEPNRAGLLMPSENENKSEDVLMLVMPVMLNR